MRAASLTHPQSHNLYAYTQNMPTDFSDPLGLNMVEGGYYTWTCYITWRSDADGSNFQITSVSCHNTGYFPGNGETGGGLPGDIAKETPKNCIDALKAKGLWDKMVSLEKSANFFNIQDIGDQPASKYFGRTINPGMGPMRTRGFTVNDIFLLSNDYAFTYIHGINGSGKTGIYSLYDRDTLPNDVKIHELAHLALAATGDQDIALATKLGLKIDGKITGKSASDALNNYFASGCDAKLLNGNKK